MAGRGRWAIHFKTPFHSIVLNVYAVLLNLPFNCQEEAAIIGQKELPLRDLTLAGKVSRPSAL